MNGRELSDLIQQRWSTLKELLEMSDRQVLAIEAGHHVLRIRGNALMSSEVMPGGSAVTMVGTRSW